ncbi:helical backbone metal receptor [Cytobacillus sp. FSL R5-0569]|uniref:ABC transporter substrate-binding protein n=1 Tax=unclassified Cytobacillus TaxID=2675268 RepID=UPI0030F6D973
MKKWYLFLVSILLSAGILAGCGNDTAEPKKDGEEKVEESTETSAFPVTLTDAADQEVVIEEEPEAIVSLIPSNTEIAFELGLGEKVVGVSDFDNYPEEVADIEKIGGQEFNVEAIIALNPDVVLAHNSGAHNSTEGLDQLRDAGITVLIVNDAQNFEEVYDSIEMIGKATGATEEANQTVEEMKTRLAEIEEKAKSVEEKKSVFVEISAAPSLYTAGQKTFIDDMLNLIQAENVIEEEGWPQIDEEAVIEKNPDVIITTYGYYTENAVETLLSREGWQDVTAVKEKQVYDVHSDKVTRTGPRLVEGVEELAKAIYPEVFK